VTNPDIVDAAMERIFEIHAGIVRRAMKAAGDLIDFVYVAEDLGTQESADRLFPGGDPSGALPTGYGSDGQRFRVLAASGGHPP